MDGLSGAAMRLAAKSGRETDAWLPLWMHLEDTAGMMAKLIRHWLPGSVQSALGLSEEEALRVGVFLGAAHDIGKCTPLFESRIAQGIPGLSDALAQCGVPLYSCSRFPDAAKTPHALAGETILRHFGCRAGPAAVVGAHHGKPQRIDADPENQLEDYWTNYFGAEDDRIWEKLWGEYIAFALARAGYSQMEEIPELSMPAQVLLTGLLIMADWIASAVQYFPLIPLDCTGDTNAYPGRVDRAWKLLALPDLWMPERDWIGPQEFRSDFGFAPNAVQREVLQVINEAEEAGILILEAPMGIGKTEAALAAAQVLAARQHCGGVFFGLPTQATANGIFPRLETWAEHQSETAVHAIRLAHGAAELNEDYINLFAKAENIGADSEEGGLIAHDWFEGRKQALLADFVIGTVDQLLLAALKQKHVMLRHLGLAGKVVIVDECHAYDAYMNEYLDMALTWLGAYHIPVILLSATLPQGRRTELARAYCRGRSGSDEAASQLYTAGYPLLTWSERGTLHQKAIQDHTTPKTVEVGNIPEDKMTAALAAALCDGGCAGIVLNTVRRAQRMAETLKESMPDTRILLFHAQFTAVDRAEIEKELLERVGKHSAAKDRDHLVVVGTQVLEQSLDIDFDLLITDLCPMDLLLQRLGRLQRHDGRSRPAPLQKPRCLIVAPSDAAANNVEKGTAAIYDEWILRRTRALLPAAIVLPQDISPLVQAVYDESVTAEEKDEAAEKYLLKRKRQQDKAQAFCVSAPARFERFPAMNTIRGWLDNTKNADDAHAEAAVRDGSPSLAVLLMMRTPDGKIHFLPWMNGGTAVDAGSVPAPELCRKIISQRIRLPYVLSGPWAIDKVIRQLEEQNARFLPEWQNAPLLRGELVLLLNSDLRAELDQYDLQYSRDAGMVCTRKENA